METLRQPRHIRVGGQFYVAQFFDPETKDVLAGPVPEVPLDPAGTVLGRREHVSTISRRLRNRRWKTHTWYTTLYDELRADTDHWERRQAGTGSQPWLA